FFQAEDGIRDFHVTGVQTCALPILAAPGMVYEINEEVEFDVAIYKYGQLVQDAEIRYQVGPEMMEPAHTETMVLKSGKGVIKGGKMNVPGFLRCHIFYNENGMEYRNSGTAGIEPEKIQPTTTVPSDIL